MYISRMPLNGVRPAALELMGSPSKMHGAIEAAFPPSLDGGAFAQERVDEKRNDGRVLWRVDPIAGEGRKALLYVVSPGRPDFTHLCEQTGWPVEGAWETRDYEPLLGRVEKGQQWQFRLKANPVRKVIRDKGVKSGKDVIGTVQGHVTAEQQAQWLFERAAQNGFSVCRDKNGCPQLRVSQREKHSFSHAGSKATLATAVFDGVLEVEDAELFCRALRYGIGRAKAFGCGLLTVSPLA